MCIRDRIDGKVKISSAACGIANFTTMNHGSELLIHAQPYIGEQGHLTYNGGHLLLNVTTIGMDFGLSRLCLLYTSRCVYETVLTLTL